eukprot:487105-Rhodomonas_salina.1
MKNPLAVTGFDIILDKAKNDQPNYRFGIFNGKLYTWTGDSVYSSKPNVLQQNVWTHVAMTAVNTKIKFYVDGLFDSEFDQNRGSTNEGSLTIGCGNEGNNHYYQGSLDNVRLYSKELTEAEVSADMTTAQVAIQTSTNLVAAREFRDGDISGLESEVVKDVTHTYAGKFFSPSWNTCDNAVLCDANEGAFHDISDNTCKCDAGFYGDGETCTACTEGYHCLAESTRAAGVACRAGYYCAGGTAPEVECTCEEGFYCPAVWTPIDDANPTVRRDSVDPAEAGRPCPPNMYCAGNTSQPVPLPLVCDLAQSCGPLLEANGTCAVKQSTFFKYNDPAAHVA